MSMSLDNSKQLPRRHVELFGSSITVLLISGVKLQSSTVSLAVLFRLSSFSKIANNSANSGLSWGSSYQKEIISILALVINFEIISYLAGQHGHLCQSRVHLCCRQFAKINYKVAIDSW